MNSVSITILSQRSDVLARSLVSSSHAQLEHKRERFAVEIMFKLDYKRERFVVETMFELIESTFLKIFVFACLRSIARILESCARSRVANVENDLVTLLFASESLDIESAKSMSVHHERFDRRSHF